MSKSADAFRTISEVADWLGVPAHVLRFWESKFTQLKPVKRAGGRRYYRPADMQLLGGIRKMLHDDGMTIKGVQKVMREQGVRYVAALSPPLDVELEAPVAGIALDVPEQEDEPRGQIVSFQRRPSDTARSRDVLENIAETEQAASPADEPVSQTTEAIFSEEAVAPAAQHISDVDAQAEPEADTDLPALPEDAAPEIAESAAGDVAVSVPALPRIIPVVTPDDPSDSAAALPSALSALAKAGRRATMAENPRIADVIRRLVDLRARMARSGKSI